MGNTIILLTFRVNQCFEFKIADRWGTELARLIQIRKE